MVLMIVIAPILELHYLKHCLSLHYLFQAFFQIKYKVWIPVAQVLLSLLLDMNAYFYLKHFAINLCLFGNLV